MEWSDPNNPGKQKPRISQTSELAVEEDLCEVFYYPINLPPKKISQDREVNIGKDLWVNRIKQLYYVRNQIQEPITKIC